MKSKIFAFILSFILIFSLITVNAELFNKNKENCDLSELEAEIPGALDELNSNPKYIEFISQSDYDAVKINAGGNIYYFAYEDNIVKQVESAEEDFTIKINCNRINKIINAYNSNDSKYIKMIIHQIPGRVKVNLINQCMKTEWCKAELLGE
jgi:hypothetical protein